MQRAEDEDDEETKVMVESAPHSNSLDDFFFNGLDLTLPVEMPNELNDDNDDDDEDDEEDDDDDDEEQEEEIPPQWLGNERNAT